MAVVVPWISSEPWVGSFAWAQQHPTTDRNTYLDSRLVSDGTSVAVITGGAQVTASLWNDGVTRASLAPEQLLNATLTME